MVCDQQKWTSHQPNGHNQDLHYKDGSFTYDNKKNEILTNESKHIWKKIGVLHIRNDSSMEDKISPTKFGQSRIYIYTGAT